MLIESPCRLGEQFDHTRPWGSKGPLYLTGLDFFLWSTRGMNNVTLHGSRLLGRRYTPDFFDPGRDTKVLYTFQVPDILFGDGTLAREIGFNSDRLCRLRGVYLREDNAWYYRIYFNGGGALEGPSAVLDKLFAQILPAVSVQVTDFL